MDDENVANKGEAEKCRDLAKSFLSKGEYEKAIKFFEKSYRLYPLAGVNALKEKAQSLLAEDSKRGAHNSSSSSSNHNHRNTSSSTPHTSRSNTNSTAASDTTASTPTSRPFTPEQEEGAKKILRASKKSYYEVLAISKSAKEDEIKKAYRKLALKFHPDKNSAPSAEGAFKAISSSFDCLSDPQKREAYDEYGHEASDSNNGASAQAHGRGGGGFGNAQHMTPEDLFNMFFMGGMPGAGGARFGGHRFNTHQQQQQRQRQQQQQDGQAPGVEPGNFQQLLQLLPILMLVLMTFSTFGGQNGGQAPFALSPHGSYQIKRTTNLKGISLGIPYYVNSKFHELYGGSKDGVFRVEKSVELNFKEELIARCNQEQDYKAKKVMQARYRRSTEEMEKAKSIGVPACDEYTSRFSTRKNKGGGKSDYAASEFSEF